MGRTERLKSEGRCVVCEQKRCLCALNWVVDRLVKPGEIDSYVIEDQGVAYYD